MLLSVDTNILRDRFDDHTAIKMIREAGFDAFDYSMSTITTLSTTAIFCPMREN